MTTQPTHTPNMQPARASFFSVPLAPTGVRPRANEREVERIYNAARLGLKGDALALRAGFMPDELRRLKGLDPAVELAILKGKADMEAEMAEVVVTAAQNGDYKAAMDVLKHAHGWSAATQVNVSVQGQISITEALSLANARVSNLPPLAGPSPTIQPVIDATYTEVEKAPAK